ncbi:MAG TPA: cyclase family protein [Gemmatimonadaceae bacterium]|nr:cyclase family protein [Gemmatimonadaceae bacterium]
MVTLHDITIAAGTGTPEWPGDTPFSCGWPWSIAAGASVNVSAITMSPHVGTHADAPMHVKDGWPASDSLDASVFLGPVAVRSLNDDEHSLGALLSSLPGDTRTERLLLRTGQSIAGGRFPETWPVLTVDVAEQLIARGLTLLGVDAPSVDAKESKTLDVHHALFRGRAAIVENLDLRGVGDGEYELVALPMRLIGVDAAPVRAFLRMR